MSNVPDSPLGPTPDFPNRPSHPDFARLVELVLQLDGRAKEDQDVDVIIREIIDGESLSYMAFQRALRAMGRPGDPVLRAAGCYLEAFIMGYRYRERYGEDGADKETQQ